MTNPTKRWRATWIEKRVVSGFVYATSKSDAEKRIRRGEGRALHYGKRDSSSPLIRDRA